MISKTTNFKLQKGLLISAIAIYPLINIFQGIDFTDFGFSASNYKFVFTNPGSLYTTFFPTYLTNILGGLVYLALGSLGLISFKIAYVLEIYLLCYLVYKLLVRFFDVKTVLFSLVVSTIYLKYYVYGTLNWINYNDLTAIFYAASGILIYHGLEEKKQSLLFSGFFLGLNFFVRVSNLAGISLAAVLIIDHLLNRESTQKSFTDNLVLFGSGILLGVASVASVMALLGHLSYYASSFLLLNDFKSLTPSHNIKGNLSTYVCDLGQSLFTASYYVALGFILLFLAKHIKLKNRFLLMIIGLILSYILVKYDFKLLSMLRGMYSVRWLFWQSGVVVIMLLFLLYKTQKENYPLFKVALISLIILVITPLGSNRSLLNANYGMWLALPLIISVFLDNNMLYFKPVVLQDNSSFLFKLTILTVISLYALDGNLHQLYRDSSSREKMFFSIDDDYFKGIYTTETRAKSIRELMQAVKVYTKPSGYVLGHEYFSMANYITDCPPYQYNPNPMLFSFDVYKFLYFKARSEIPDFPVILAAKGQLSEKWPDNVQQGLKHPDPAYDDLLNKQRAFVDALKKEGRYRKVWENIFFEIWCPRSRPSRA